MPSGGSTREFEIDVLDRRIEVADGVFADAWTFSGTVPGPVIRAVEGDTVRIRFRNRTGHPHNLHFHGRHHPAMDGWEPIPPGGETTYDIDAGPAGVHPYHCHVQPLAEHIGRGLYGMFIVDPPGGRPAATEVALVLGGFAVDGVRNAVVAWNGVAGFYHRHPIKVGMGELVRCYVLNMVEYEPVASFHLHAQTFDVYPTGTGSRPSTHTDVVTLGQAERAILEFRLPELGRYMFHPHQHHLASRGSMGWFAAV
jgi:FtsP/CotA-like multicopper oxidase with cupredoxin domain